MLGQVSQFGPTLCNFRPGHQEQAERLPELGACRGVLFLDAPVRLAPQPAPVAVKLSERYGSEIRSVC